MIENLAVIERDGVGAGKPHWSHSRISRYLLCPEQHWLYYQERIRAAVSTVRKALAKNSRSAPASGPVPI